MGINFSKLKKHEKYNENFGNEIDNIQNNTKIQNRGVLNNNNTQSTLLANVNRTDNNTIMQRVQAKYEENMRQTEAMKNNTNNMYKVDYSQKMDNNNGGYRSTTNKTPNIFEIARTENGVTKNVQLPTKQSVSKNNGKLPTKYEEDKNAKDSSWYKRILQKPKVFEDGYNFGDVTKTVLGTTSDIGLGFAKGIAGVGEGVGKAISGGVAQVADWTGHDEYAQKVRNRLAGKEEGYFDKKYLPTNLISTAQEKVNKASISGEYADKASESMGYMAGLIALNYVAPGSDVPAMFLNATGNSLEEVYSQNENVEDWQAWTKAISSGTIETVIEKSSGFLGGKGIGEKTAGKIASKISSGAGKSISKLLGVATDEAVEEFKSYIANYGLDRAIDSVSKLTGSEVKFSQDWNWGEVGEAMGLAFATSLIMGGSNIQSNIKNENTLNKNELIDSSNLGPNSKEQLKRLSEKNNWKYDNLKNMLEQGGNLNNQSIVQNQGQKLINNPPNNEILNNNQHITQEQNKTAENENMGQIEQNNKNQVKIDSKNFAKQVDNYISGNMKSSDFINVGKTSQVLQNIGLPNNNIILKQSKLKAIMQESNNPNSKLHGLSVETVKRIPEALANPLNVLQSSTNKNSVVVISDLADKMERPVIASIEINYKGQIGNIDFLSNRLTSAYGKNNYDRFMQTEITKENLLYDIDEGIIKELPTSARVQFPEGLNSSVDTVDNVSTSNIISQNTNKMQVQNEKGKNLHVNSTNANNETNQKNILVKNEETEYNNVESEGGINGKTQNVERNDRAGWSGQIEEGSEVDENEQGINRGESNQTDVGSQKENDFSESYRQEEKRIREQKQLPYEQEEQHFVDNIKSKYNKNAIIYDDSKTFFGGGVSSLDSDTILFGRNALKNYGKEFLEGHEILEDIYKNHKDVSESKINEFKQRVQEDSSFGDVFLEYLSTVDDDVYQYYVDKPNLIAKEIIADINGITKSGQDISKTVYGKLNQDLIAEIQNTIKDFEKQIYNTENAQNEGSFLLSQNPKKNISMPMKMDSEEATFSEMVPQNPGKMRKHYDSIIKSKYTSDEARKIAKEMMGIDTYVPETNKGQLQQADERIKSSSPQAELSSLMSRSMTGGKIDSIDIAVGERLIQYYSKTGDSKKLRDAIHATALSGTSAGQTVQAMSLLNHQTPEGQAIWIERSIEKINKELAQKKGGTIQTDENGNVKVVDKRGKDITNKVQLYKLTDEMLSTITNSTKENLAENLDKVYEELGQQVPKTLVEQIDSWRYFSMLANVRTHIRNIVGNKIMEKTQIFKNKLAGIIEGVMSEVNSEMERTHTIVTASKEVKQFAKNDIKNVEDRLELNDSKYNPKTRLQNNQRTFKSNIAETTLGTAFNLNDKALEAEDGWGLKACYSKALAEYMTANELTPQNITDVQLGKARNYAIKEAKEATFHQENTIASAINQFSKKNKVTKFITDSALPFVKTPMNVAATAVEYSPIGLGKTLVKNSIDLRKGNITVNQYIDNISKGLTGSGITFLGYVLAEAGILKASGDDDDKLSKFESDQGKQSYSIQIGDNTYSLDWLAPVGIPLFIGAELHALKNAKLQEKNSVSNDDNTMLNQVGKSAGNLFNALATAMNPMTEMSMLSGLTSTLSSYEENKLAGIMTNMSKSYVNQFVPTALGQVAKVTDDYERSTTSTKTGLISKTIDQTANQIKAKIPGLRKSLPVKTDIWGDEQKTTEDIYARAFETFIAPYTKKEIKDTALNKALSKLYKDTGEGSVLPSSIEKDMTIDKQKYRYTDKEYANAKKEYGKNAKSILTELTMSNNYNKMSDTEKVMAISDVYSYVKEELKKNYADDNKLELKTSTLYDTVTELQNKKANIASYFQYKAQTTKMEKDVEKMKYLSDLKTDNKTKDIIYTHNIMDKPEDGKTTEYEELKEYYANNSIPGSKNYRAYDIINQYLDYKGNANNKIKELRANGTKKENENLNEVEKIQVLKDSSYTNAQTEALYSTVVAEERGHKIYEELKKINGGNSIQSYMTFMLSDRESEKEDDGTLSGKSISGSKLHKVQNTLKGIGQLNTISKIYLEATQASIKKYASKDYEVLRSYLNKATEKEQTIIMETIQGTTKMKNGKYKY